MARSAGWFILKWLLIPAALAAAGYYIIGPRIGALAPSKAGIDTGAPAPQTPPAHDSATTGNQTSYPAPDVTVTRGSGQVAPAPPRRHRRRSTKPKPDAATTPDQPAQSDQGGSGGAATTTGGGDGTTTGGDTGNDR